MDWKSTIRTLLEQDKPGERAHLPMAPVGRPISSLARKEANNYRESAVSIVLIDGMKSKEIILIQRPTYEGSHSGQISFPGGKHEHEDPSLFHTAIRETREEIGIELTKDHLVGELTPVFIPVSRFHVQPYLFYLSEEPRFVPDNREVAEVFTITLEELFDPTTRSTMEYDDGHGTIIREIPCFQIRDRQIWGATALMLNEIHVLFTENKLPY